MNTYTMRTFAEVTHGRVNFEGNTITYDWPEFGHMIARIYDMAQQDAAGKNDIIDQVMYRVIADRTIPKDVKF